MAACPLCRSRKGKRFCPALRQSICSVCCGEKRLVEIDCPSDCVWLGRGTQNEFTRATEDYLRHQEPSKARRWFETVSHLGPILEGIERVVAAAAPRSLGDDELLAVLQALRKSFEHEAKGVIYEELPPAPALQVLTREIAKGIAALLAGLRAEIASRGGAAPDLGPAEAGACLAVLVDRCEFHLRRAGDSGPYLALIRRFYPPRAGQVEEAPGRIILT